MDRSLQDHTDAAALGGSVVAVAMPIFADPGRYDLLGVTVTCTLLLLIQGFLLDRVRTPGKSLALAAVVAIVALPILGWAGDCWKWALWSDFHDYNNWLASLGGNPMAEEPSTVSDDATLVAWLATTLAAMLADRWILQPRIRARRDAST